MIQHISAVTFAVRAMPEAITFYTQLGFTLVYGSLQARFSTLQAGEALVNLTLASNFKPTWWGRTIFRVDDVDTLEFIPLSFWYDAPLISPYSDRRHDPWQVCGSPTSSPV